MDPVHYCFIVSNNGRLEECHLIDSKDFNIKHNYPKTKKENLLQKNISTTIHIQRILGNF